MVTLLDKALDLTEGVEGVASLILPNRSAPKGEEVLSGCKKDEEFILVVKSGSIVKATMMSKGE